MIMSLCLHVYFKVMECVLRGLSSENFYFRIGSSPVPRF